jgi:predicted Zn-dependent protease
MKHFVREALTVLCAFAVATSPAFAQLGGLGGALKKAQQVQEAKQKFDDMTFSDAEERQIGDDVSAKIRQRFGVVQDPAIHKYVALVGTTLAKASSRPNLQWTFVVLDTDGVNAFASPGGIIHITRGALGLLRNEAELAGVLGHEIAHVTEKHTINAIQKGKMVQAGTSATLSSRAPFLDEIANRAYELVLENNFDRNDELGSDRIAVTLTQQVGYAPTGLGEFLRLLDERNTGQAEKNGLFASHPETKERIDRIAQLGRSSKASALVEARYKSNVQYTAVPVTEIAEVMDGSAGLTGGSKPAGGTTKPAPSEEEAAAAKKKGFGLSALKPTVAPEKSSTQVSASGGARGVGPDRAARGGDNPNLVAAAVSASELAAFKKGIV